MLLALNKPYGILSQFTPEPGSQWNPLASLHLPPNVYPIGRLDADSEGLLLLSDEKALVDRLLNPRNAHSREYWAQVEKIPSEEALSKLRKGGLQIADFRTLPCKVSLLDPQPVVPERIPPIRVRKNIPDAWISLDLIEGKNRQVRRMTAAIGHPTLRLLRIRIGRLRLDTLGLPPGSWLELSPAQRSDALAE